MNYFRPGDKIRLTGRPEKIFTVSKHYDGGPLVECVDEGGSGFCPFHSDLEPVPQSETEGDAK